MTAFAKVVSGPWILRAAAIAALGLSKPHDPLTPQASSIATEIETSEPVAATLFGDVDADGRKDLVLLCERRVLVHRLHADGHLSTKPDTVVKLPNNAVAIDLRHFETSGATHAIPKARLLVAAGDELFVRDLSMETAPFELVKLPFVPHPLLPLGAGANPIAMSLADDLDSDGLPEIFLPVADGVAVLKLERGAWTLLGVANTKLSVKIETGEDRPGAVVRHGFELPRAAIVDVGKPGAAPKRYLAITRGLDSFVFGATATGLTLFERARGLYRFDDEDRFREIRGTRRNEDVNDRSVGLVPMDVNGDGIPDFISSRFKDGQVFITFGRQGEFVAGTPDRVIDVDGWVIIAQAKDFDGDGYPDLVVPRLPRLGISGAIKAILQRRIDLELWIFRNRGNAEAYSSTPDWKYTFDVEVQLGGEDGKFSATARMIAGFYDVNGDGLRDFITSRDYEKLSVYLGNRESLLAEDESFSIPIPSVAKVNEVDLRSCDVNGDNREDLLLLYGSNKKGAKNKLLFLLWKNE